MDINSNLNEGVKIGKGVARSQLLWKLPPFANPYMLIHAIKYEMMYMKVVYQSLMNITRKIEYINILSIV